MTKVIFKRTKILATLGPATHSPEMIEKLALAGANGFRMNFSHCTYEECDQRIAWARQVSAKTGKPVAVLQDLQGPKVRLGSFPDNVEVKAGDEIILDKAVEDQHDLVFPSQYNLAEKVKVGQPVYIFDGKIKATAIEIVSPTAIKLRIENGGMMMARKGINLPETDFGGDILTPKDIRDIEYGADKDIDFVALSFVQSADDIHSLRQMLISLGSNAQIIAKIETKAAIKDGVLEDIIEASDGVMVARGDLAVEAGPETVPIAQRRIVSLCRRHGKLSIVATQMMASMVDSPEPTRAEVGDVANAVIQGADAVMLSEETAAGNYPVETVQVMKRTILYTQDHAPVAKIDDRASSDNDQRDAISMAAVKLAQQLDVAAIIAETGSGATATNIAVYRPNMPIVSVTSIPRVAQQLSLNYANRSYVRPTGETAGLSLAKELKASGYFGEDPTTVIIVSGRQPGLVGATDTIRVRVLE